MKESSSKFLFSCAQMSYNKEHSTNIQWYLRQQMTSKQYNLGKEAPE